MELDQPYVNQELIREMRAFLKAQDFDLFGTIAFNRETTVDGLRRRLKRFHQHVDRSLLGKRFDKRPPQERTLFFAFIEHRTSNLHLHLMIKVPPGTAMTERYSWVAPRKLKKLLPKADLKLSPLREMTDLYRTVDYSTKELWERANFEDFIISTEFLKSSH